MVGTRTSREADGQTIPGVTRLAFIKNGGTYFLSELVIYADGMVDCWGLVNLEEFEGKVRSGWVATELEEGSQASAHHVAAWTIGEPRWSITSEALVGEVRDTVDKLAGRPDSADRCLAALRAFLDDPSKKNQTALLDAYLAVPEHVRAYLLGDMDSKDWPIQAIAVGVGGKRPRDGMCVSEDMHTHALQYFAEKRGSRPDWPRPRPRARTAPVLSPVQVPNTVYPRGVEDAPAIHRLRNSFPCRVQLAQHEFPDIETAWHALSVDDDATRAKIAAATRPYDAMKLAQGVPKRAGWDQSREAVMLMLLRAKFAQHPELASILLDTGDSPISYHDLDAHWSGTGRSWMGRLLELVRSEIRAQRSGLKALVEGT